MALGFAQPWGFLALGFILLFILLYLIRPQPKKLAVPSLTFFLKRSHASKRESFFRHFFEDLLFLLQLFTLLLLVLSIVDPLLKRKEDLASQNIVFVLDISASSQVHEGDTTRFALSVSKIKSFASTDHNTLVLAKSNPLVALQNVNKAELLRFLDRLHPTDDESRLGEAILLAGELLQGKGRVIVLSDFITTRGMTAETARNVLYSKQIQVDFISTVLGKRNNIGIIQLLVDDTTTTTYVKNYGDTLVQATLSVDNATVPISLRPHNTEPVSFQTKSGITQLTLLPKDDFDVDNTAWISTPFQKEVPVLLISNQPSKYLLAALQSSRHFEVTKAKPPVIPEGDYAVYIFDHVDRTTLLPGTFADLAARVQKGASLVLNVQDDSYLFDYSPLPFQVHSPGAGGQVQILQTNRFTQDVDFGAVQHLFPLESKQNKTIPIAVVGNTSVVALTDYGNGKIVYYGFVEAGNEFLFSPSYPLFWTNLVAYLSHQPELQDINLKTGAVYSDSEQTLILDKTGVFDLGGQKIAVSLLNDKESSINPEEQQAGSVHTFSLETLQQDTEQSFTPWLLLIVLILVFLEFFYTKYRGEL